MDVPIGEAMMLPFSSACVEIEAQWQAHAEELGSGNKPPWQNWLPVWWWGQLQTRGAEFLLVGTVLGGSIVVVHIQSFGHPNLVIIDGIIT